MKYCALCGTELQENAKICRCCGGEVPKAKEQKIVAFSRNTKIWIILGAVALALGIIAAVLFVPRNLKLEDFEETNVVTAIIKYGLPNKIDSHEDRGVVLRYRDKINFYGITSGACDVFPEEGLVSFLFYDEDGDAVYRKIKRYCELEDRSSSFHYFSYGNLKITTFAYSGSYVIIEIN